MRARDGFGRPVPEGSPDAVEQVDERPLPPREALAVARDLLGRGRAFSAHEVLEAAWKAAPDDERDLWQGLAQLCVGVTHLQRGNLVGGARLLRRGAGRLPATAAYGLRPEELARWARAVADEVDAGRRDAPMPPL